MNTRKKSKTVVVTDSSDDEAVQLTGCAVSLEPLFPQLINLGDSGGKFPPGGKNVASCNRISRIVETAEDGDSDGSSSPHMPSLMVEGSAPSITPVDTAARVLPGSVVGVSPKPADGNSSNPAGGSSVRNASVPLDPGTSAMPCKVELEPLLESDGVPEDPVGPVNFRWVAGGLVTVVLRAMDQQGHLGVSTTLLDEIRAQCPEAAENHLSITLLPLVLQALALNRDTRRAFRRWSRKGNVSSPKGSYIRTCEGPALRLWNFRAGWNFGFWSLVSDIVDRFVSQRRPVSEEAFLSSLAELLLQTNPDPVIPN